MSEPQTSQRIGTYDVPEQDNAPIESKADAAPMNDKRESASTDYDALVGPEWGDLGIIPLPEWLADAQMVVTPSHTQWFVPKLTPAMAMELCKRRHPGQRNVRMRHERNLRRAMESKDWHDTGIPFAVLTTSGYLADGQHRALALAKAALPYLENISVVQVKNDKSIAYIDTAIKQRNVSDVLNFMGHIRPPHSVIAAICFESSGFIDSRDVPLAQRAVLVAQCPYVEEITELWNAGHKLRVQHGSLAGALHCIRVNRDAAMAFFRAAFTNQHDVRGVEAPQAHLLADHLIQAYAKRAGKHFRGDPVADATVAVRAYNFWRQGATRLVLRPTDTAKQGMPAALK
jgi:hypothetical protein